jgi:hypothetical protein
LNLGKKGFQKMKLHDRVMALTLLVVLLGSVSSAQQVAATKDRSNEERLSFQTHAPWSPRINLNSDVVMTYGIDPEMSMRLESWRLRGYKIQLMTGVAWGEYQDYLYGRFDGKNHWDQAQKDSKGNLVQHGVDVPYISPGKDYGNYLTVGVKRALDAGAEAVYLEEPEFWARSGWEDNFKREWKAYYGEDWQAPDSSPDAQYRASKLKYMLYRRALAQIFDFVKIYNQEHGRNVHCYVPTHSLINYANWGIVSPESSLINVGADGYIAQIWTGTAREPNYYKGVLKERTFETAFLEYGAMQNLVRASGRRVWYLNDPIEDNANLDWVDYRTNWESTLTASLLQPEVWRYEIMPWPERVFNGKHLAVKNTAGSEDANKIQIPKSYETELQSVVSALGDMKQSDVRWENAGTKGIGILVSDTMMFQRAAPVPSDAKLGSFYGLALPLIKRGIPVEPVQIESVKTPGLLSRYKILYLTYEGQKPPQPEFHTALAKWVRAGGSLIVIDDDKDPYNAVREWWNTAPNAYQTPRQHLFAKLGIDSNASGFIKVGQGSVIYAPSSPASLSHDAKGDLTIEELGRQAAASVKLPWKEAESLVLRRGPYVVAAGLDESNAQSHPYVLRGRYINLFDSKQTPITDPEILPNSRKLLVDLSAAERSGKPRIVAAACRIKDVTTNNQIFSFHANGIADTMAVVTIFLPKKPGVVKLGDKVMGKAQYHYKNHLLHVEFPNLTDEISVKIDLKG